MITIQATMLTQQEVDTFNTLRRLDIEFWSNLCDSSLQEDGYQLESLCFYGEIALLFLGLKHCVMFSGLTKKSEDSLMKKYIEAVLTKSRLFETFPLLKLHRLHANLQLTSDNYDASGEYLLWREDDNHEKLEQMKQVFLLEPEKPTHRHVSETAWSSIFDYPSALPEQAEMRTIIDDGGSAEYDLCEVAYFDVMNENEKRIVTTYGSRRIMKHLENAKEHYLRYKRTAMPLMNLAMEIAML